MEEVDGMFAGGKKYPEPQVAMVVLDPYRRDQGSIGGRNYGVSQLNRTRRRQPGPSSNLRHAAALNTTLEGRTRHHPCSVGRRRAHHVLL